MGCRFRSKKKAFKNHEANYATYDKEDKIQMIEKYCSVIRVIAHTQVRGCSLDLLSPSSLCLSLSPSLPLSFSLSLLSSLYW